METEKKAEYIAMLILTAKEHAYSIEHKHSLLKFTVFNGGFSYIDSFGTEFIAVLCIDNSDTLHCTLVCNPLPGEKMNESDVPTIIEDEINSSIQDEWEELIRNMIDDYMYRDDPVYCGIEPYKL